MKFDILSLFISFPKFASKLEWGYSGDIAPDKWGDLKPEFKICKCGKSQSPVEVDSKTTVEIDELNRVKIEYKNSNVEIVNTGNSIQVNPKDGGKISIAKDEYKLVQFHFHSKSEHMIDKMRHDMVIHFVHQRSESEFAVVAVFIDEGTSENLEIETIWNLAKDEIDSKVYVDSLDINSLLPKNIENYYHYIGSLTTPDCTEGIKWYLIKEPILLSKEQIERFRRVYPENIRPLQPLNGRVIEES